MSSFLRMSFYSKLGLFLVEAGLAIAFIVGQCRAQFDVAAVLEWMIAYIFYLYILSFSLDFL